MRALSLVLVLFASAGSAACTERSLINRIATQVRVADSTIRLDAATPFAWDTVYLFGPYTPASIVRQRLADRISSRMAASMEMAEGEVLLVFVADGRIVASARMPRYAGDFTEVARAGPLTPEQAVFRVTGRGSWPYLVMATGPLPN